LRHKDGDCFHIPEHSESAYMYSEALTATGNPSITSYVMQQAQTCYTVVNQTTE